MATCRIFVGALAAILVAAGIIWMVMQAHEEKQAEANLARQSERSDKAIELYNRIYNR